MSCRLHYTEQIRTDILSKYGVGKTSAQLVKPNIILLPIGGIDNSQNKLQNIKNTNEWAIRIKKEIDAKYNSKLFGSQLVIDNNSNPRGTLVKIEIKSKLIDAFEKRDNPKILYQIDNNKVDYQLKVIKALESDKVRQPKQSIIQGFYNDLIKQGIPNNQLDLIKNIYKDGMTKEELISNLLANMSYTIEINTAKAQQEPAYYNEDTGVLEGGMYEKNSEYYSNLTVPGGTNYTENEIATPAITPNIKGHAQFATDKGIGWFRSDDKENKIVGWKEEDDFLSSETAQYNPITKDDKIIFGHPTIGKSYLKQKGNNDFITLDDDYKNEVNAFVDANRGSETRQEYKGRKPKEYNEFMLNLFDRLKKQAKKEGKKLFVSNTNILKERMSEFDKVITIPKDEFKKRFDARGATYGFEDWKSDIDTTVAKVDKSKVISTTGYLSDLLEGNPKTRRILEVQSDLFQKGRDRKSPDEIIQELQKSGKLEIKCS